ncbi:glycosyl hydrolase family 17 protein [Tenacibaculum agarivorans]|uniref:glycosyl hydrolase family 17 protein n=1 Tax=Tenacibaculum agarivorans TaxID=1908389 RepID=UPI00094BBA11|nr:glycosyl hydrolase family 17 protein [Tenacibaculum agarivorans]
MSNPIFNSIIGVNFSNTFQSSGQQVSAATAASQISEAGIKTVKMFTYNQSDCITAFANTGLQILVDVPNDDLQACAGNDKTTIDAIVQVLSDNSNAIPTLCVGNEPLGSWWNNAYAPYLVDALTNIKAAITKAGLSTKVTVPFNYAIMGVSYPPSAGAFNKSKISSSSKKTIKSIVLEVCKILASDNSAFMINVYPFITQNNQRSISLKYCLFTAENDKSVWVIDGSYTYKNIFDAMYDALYVALENNGYGSLPIVIGEAGWPTGPNTTYPSATTANAQTFNQNLINHCTSGNGTPRNSGINIPCFIFEMYDEDTKPTGAGTFEHDWGVYGYNSTKKDYEVKYPLTW